MLTDHYYYSSFFCFYFNVKYYIDNYYRYVVDRTTVKSFYIGQNESQTNATFKEHDVGIELNCIVEGKPASSIDVIFDGNLLITSSNTNILSYSFQDVTCNDGGDYICRSTDTFEQTTSKLVSLAVECKLKQHTSFCCCFFCPGYVFISFGKKT